MLIAQMELDDVFSFHSSDWGESSNHEMAKAFGLKRNRKARCKSCKNYSKGHCLLMSDDSLIQKNYRACARYQSKKTIKK